METNTRLAFSAMRRILRGVEGQRRALMAGTGLSPSQLVLLQALENGVERRVSDLAADLGISVATTTVMCQRLEARGLLSRRQDSRDRRQSWLSLSDAGNGALRAAPDSVQARFTAEFERLREWEQMAIIAGLTRVAEMLDTDDDAAPILDSDPILTGGTVPPAG